jgi:hypothetical protein
MVERDASRQWDSSVLETIWRENAAIRADLVAAVARLNDKQLAHEPAPGKWSIGEILDHLCLAERSMTRTISRLLQQAAGLGLIGPAWSAEAPGHAIDLAVYQRPAIAPDGVLPLPGRPLAGLLDALEESRARLLEVCARADGRVVGNFRLTHFQLGELNFYQWLTVVGVHEAKHLAQVRAIAALPGFPAA